MGSWVWSNFTWQNASVTSGVVSWKIFYEDGSGNVNGTGIQSFTVVARPEYDFVGINTDTHFKKWRDVIRKSGYENLQEYQLENVKDAEEPD